jgi:hypothetical protein
VWVKRSHAAGSETDSQRRPEGSALLSPAVGEQVEDVKLRSELGSLHDDEVEITIQKRPGQIVNLDDDGVREVKAALVV